MMGALAVSDEQGWGELYDERGSGGGMAGLGAVDAAPLVYVPNLVPVGSGASYSPGSITADAHALNFLGFIPDALLGQIPDTSTTVGGSVAQDQAQQLGAFNPTFRQAVTDFQQTNGGLTVDGFIGPATRTALAAAVAAKNAQSVPTAPPFTPPVVPGVPGVPPNLPVPGGLLPPVPNPNAPQPAAAQTSEGFPTVPVVIGGAVVLALVAAYFLID
jgi:hypothetical protein